jgi:hypothetical protein
LWPSANKRNQQSTHRLLSASFSLNEQPASDESVRMRFRQPTTGQSKANGHFVSQLIKIAVCRDTSAQSIKQLE